MEATKCSWGDEQIKNDVVHVYNGILLSHKKNETMLFAATWIDLEIIILSAIQKRMTNTTLYHSYVESNIQQK